MKEKMKEKATQNERKERKTNINQYERMKTQKNFVYPSWIN
jgi:hypothetical protein